MDKIQELTVEGQYTVTLYQIGRKSFVVRYGSHTAEDLDYIGAAHEFGECVMHALQCAGMLD